MKRILLFSLLLFLLISCDDLFGDGEVEVKVTNLTDSTLVLFYPCEAHQSDDWPLFKQCSKKIKADTEAEISALYFDGRIHLSYVREIDGKPVFQSYSTDASDAEEDGYAITQ